MNAAKACACCGQKKAHEREDWNEKLGINAGIVIRFTNPKSLGKDPPDLQ